MWLLTDWNATVDQRGLNNWRVKVSGLIYRFLLRKKEKLCLVFLNVTPCPSDHAGPVPQWNNEIRGISVYHRLYHLVSINRLHQSSQGPGNPSRSEVLSTDTPTTTTLLRPMWLQTGSHGKPFSHFTLFYDASVGVCGAYFIAQRNPTLAFRLPFSSSAFAPSVCATLLKIKSLSLVLTPLRCHHSVFPCTFSERPTAKGRNLIFENVCTLS